MVPVADGGEGTVEAALSAGLRALVAVVSGPTGERCHGRSPCADARRDRDGRRLRAGRAPGPPTRRRWTLPAAAGTGELITAALDAGCHRIVLGGRRQRQHRRRRRALAALGARLLDEPGTAAARRRRTGRTGRCRLDGWIRVWPAPVRPRRRRHQSPARSHRGRRRLRPAEGCRSRRRRRSLSRPGPLSGRLAAEHGPTARGRRGPGAGAAGGVGFAALAVLRRRPAAGDRRRPGTRPGSTERLAGADVVITGEGSLDAQSLGGKTPIGVARRPGPGVPVVAVCGRDLAETGAPFDRCRLVRPR